MSTRLFTRLWVLRRKGDIKYDEFDAFIVRATTAYDARAIASARCATEGRAVWFSTKDSTCKELHPQGKSELVLASFNAG